jgi:hypothetical protein
METRASQGRREDEEDDDDDDEHAQLQQDRDPAPSSDAGLGEECEDSTDDEEREEASEEDDEDAEPEEPPRKSQRASQTAKPKSQSQAKSKPPAKSAAKVQSKRKPAAQAPFKPPKKAKPPPPALPKARDAREHDSAENVDPIAFLTAPGQDSLPLPFQAVFRDTKDLMPDCALGEYDRHARLRIQETVLAWGDAWSAAGLPSIVARWDARDLLSIMDRPYYLHCVISALNEWAPVPLLAVIVTLATGASAAEETVASLFGQMKVPLLRPPSSAPRLPFPRPPPPCPPPQFFPPHPRRRPTWRRSRGTASCSSLEATTPSRQGRAQRPRSTGRGPLRRTSARRRGSSPGPSNSGSQMMPGSRR